VEEVKNDGSEEPRLKVSEAKAKPE